MAIVMRKTIFSRVPPRFNTTFIEALDVEVSSKNGSLRFVAFYCPKQSRISYHTAGPFRNDIQKLSHRSEKIVLVKGQPPTAFIQMLACFHGDAQPLTIMAGF